MNDGRFLLLSSVGSMGYGGLRHLSAARAQLITHSDTDPLLFVAGLLFILFQGNPFELAEVTLWES